LLTVCVVSVAGCFAVLPLFGLPVTLVLVLVLVLPLSSWESRAAKLCDHAMVDQSTSIRLGVRAKLSS
jgi:uncharacterized membrane protein